MPKQNRISTSKAFITIWLRILLTIKYKIILLIWVQVETKDCLISIAIEVHKTSKLKNLTSTQQLGSASIKSYHRSL